MVHKNDKYFYEICQSVSKNSKCLSRQIGSILTRDNIIISTGYNGPPRGVPHCNQRCIYDMRYQEELTKRNLIDSGEKCPRKVLGFKSGEGIEWCVATHSEKNCLVSAARNGISTLNTTLYLNAPVPCTQCLVSLINAGVTEIVCTGNDKYDPPAEFLSLYSGIRIRTFDHINDEKY